MGGGYFGCSHCNVAGGPKFGNEASSRLLLLGLADNITGLTSLKFSAPLMLALKSSLIVDSVAENYLSICVIQASLELCRKLQIRLPEALSVLQ